MDFDFLIGNLNLFFDFPLQRKMFFFAAMGKTDGDTLQCRRGVAQETDEFL